MHNIKRTCGTGLRPLRELYACLLFTLHCSACTANLKPLGIAESQKQRFAARKIKAKVSCAAIKCCFTLALIKV